MSDLFFLWLLVALEFALACWLLHHERQEHKREQALHLELMRKIDLYLVYQALKLYQER